MDESQAKNHDGMGDAMIIPPFMIDALFYLAVLVAGIDFTLSGLRVMKHGTKSLERPRLLGLFIMKLMHLSDASGNQNKLAQWMFNLRTMAIYTLIAGILILLSSLMLTLDLFARYWVQ